MNMKNKSYDEDLPGGDTLNRVIIKDGELIQGCIDNKIMDSGSKGLIHMVFNDLDIWLVSIFLMTSKIS